MFPHDKRRRPLHKGIQESDDEDDENVGERAMTILPHGPGRTSSLFGLRAEIDKIIECPPGFGRSFSTTCISAPPKEHLKAKSSGSEEHSPEPCAGPSREPPRPGPSTSLAGPSQENPKAGPSSPRPGPSRDLSLPGPSRLTPESRPSSPGLLHYSRFEEYLNQELIRQKLVSKLPILKHSAYFDHGPLNRGPMNKIPPIQGLLHQGPSPQSSPNKEVSNQEKLNQRSPIRRPAQAREHEVDTTPDTRHFTYGLSLDIICNHVKLELIPGKGNFEYQVKFFPQEDNPFFRHEMIRQKQAELGDALFFYGESLFLPTAGYDEIYFICNHPTKDSRVKMSLKYKGHASDEDSKEILNAIFRLIMTYLGLKNGGNCFIDPLGRINLSHNGLEIWPGFTTEVQKFDGGLQVCINTCNSVVHTQSILEIMRQLQENPSGFQENCMRLVVGHVVVTRYNHKFYVVNGIHWDKNPKSTFTTNLGHEITYVEHFQSHHQITVKDMNQPLLSAHATQSPDVLKKGNQEDILLIPELCHLCGLTDEMKINSKLMKDISQKFQPSPKILYDKVCKLLQNIKDNDPSQTLLSSWGVDIGAIPLRLEARVMNQETLWYKNARIDLTAGQVKWSIDHQLLTTKELKNWVILHLKADIIVAQNFEYNLRLLASSMDMKVQPGRLVEVLENNSEGYLNALRCVIDPLLQIAIILIPSKQSDIYSSVKRFCCIEQPLLSQVILTETLYNTLTIRSIMKNIAMQINCKLGGALWSTTIPYGKLMICGIDIFPDTSKKCLVMGFVSSSDSLQLSWFSKTSLRSSIEEFGDTLHSGMLCALLKYKEVSGDFPDRILVYRGGIRDDQLRLVNEIDIPNFRKSFINAAVKYQPKLTVVACQEKIITRLMAVDEGWGATLDFRNPLPGLVLDHTITRCDMYDFFLISQDNKYGTVSPTHYIVIYDTGDTPPERLQRITYKLSHLYYNSPGLISIPAPVRYAHRLAQLVGEHLHDEPSPALSDKLFFL